MVLDVDEMDDGLEVGLDGTAWEWSVLLELPGRPLDVTCLVFQAARRQHCSMKAFALQSCKGGMVDGLDSCILV